MKLTLAALAAVLFCVLSLAARSYARQVCAEEERLALEAIDGHLRGRLHKLSQR